eukprot:CAMPEP_0168515384 /NCGR_PEP_ID=MMETSP0405-20121227/4720_1 /TAXON_ID=498012 /ORGANISM="Trichosphaerium sp, Strain Am-I-7 wt" /LENGTH=295 /DNA_ID=CAMNT_0008534785 /DNA_START=970 /DNA_END=1857 /DNA_ORIENTATION=-
MNKLIKRVDLYQSDKRLGEGSMGVVYSGHYRGEEVAIKIIKFADMETLFLEQFVTEVLMMSQVTNHPNILRLIGACIEDPYLSIVTELVPFGSLRDLLDDRRVAITEARIRKVAMDTSEAVAYLHSKGFIHRDLKTDNLFVCDRWQNVKVGDFGLAVAIEKNSRIKSQVGTLAYCAPEIFGKHGYNSKVDVYSFGIVVWEMHTRKRPWESTEDIKESILGGVKLEMPKCSFFWQFLMQRCWQYDPIDRPTFKKVRRAVENMDIKFLRGSSRLSINSRRNQRAEKSKSTSVMHGFI